MSTLRELALEVLDDEYGITQDAWAVLFDLLAASNEEYEDIAEAVTGADGRVFLPENHGLR
jgi:5-hydroxyisourate hydrolase-like protein (transthyretin family)